MRGTHAATPLDFSCVAPSRSLRRSQVAFLYVPFAIAEKSLDAIKMNTGAGWRSGKWHKKKKVPAKELFQYGIKNPNQPFLSGLTVDFVFIFSVFLSPFKVEASFTAS